MTTFQNLVGGLRKAERELEAQLAGIRAAISSLIGGKATSGKTKRTRRKMSAATIAKMRRSQKARWAKKRADEKK